MSFLYGHIVNELV